MATYRQYCPVARAAEILAERWNLLIVRNLMFGADTFTAVAGGVPTMSRSMLTSRLRKLEQAGVIRSRPKPSGQGSIYELTDAGADLAGVIDSMGRWAETWVEVLPEHADPGFALWAWCQVQLDETKLPDDRTVVRFEFADQPPGNRHFWLLAHEGSAELCTTDPGGEPDLTVSADSQAFVEWHRGVRTWTSAVRSGDITTSGDRNVARALPTWNTHEPTLGADHRR